MYMRAIIVPVCRETGESLELLRELRAQTGPADCLVVVLTAPDPGARLDEVVSLAEGGNGDLFVLEAPGAYPGKARNTGIRAVPEARFIVQVDAGCQVEPGWLEAMTTPLVEGRADYVAGAVAPFRGPMRFRGIVMDREAAFMALTVTRFRRAGDIAGGCAAAYRREMWKRAGEFPEDRRYGEDLIFAARIAAQKPSLAFVGEYPVRWQIGPQAGDMLRREYAYSRHNSASTPLSRFLSSSHGPLRELLPGVAFLGLLAASALFGPLWLPAAILAGGALFMASKARNAYARYLAAARDAGKPKSLLHSLRIQAALFRLLWGIRGARFLGALAGLAARPLAPGRYTRGGFMAKALHRAHRFFYDTCIHEVFVIPAESPLPEIVGSGIGVREFTDADVPVFSAYFPNLETQVSRWRESASGYVVEKDGEPAGCFWLSLSHVTGEGPRPPYFFDVTVRPGAAYLYAVLVREKYRGNRLSAAIAHYALRQAREQGAGSVYLFADAVNEGVRGMWRRYGAQRIGALVFTRRLGVCRKNLSDLRLLCE